MGQREANLLRLLSRAILRTPGNPSRQLLEHAGIGFDDVRDSVNRTGLEATLHGLQKIGIYLSVEEMKGQQPLVRGGHTFDFSPRDVLNPLAAASFEVHTGGTRATRPVGIGFGYLTQVNVNLRAASEVLGAAGLPYFLWLPPPPAASGLFAALCAPIRGTEQTRWFAQTRPATPRQLAVTYGTLLLARSLGHSVPLPEYLPLCDAGRLLTIATRAVARRGGCVISTYVSSAMAICRVALRRRASLEGVLFLPSAEPLTESRRRLIQETGARVAVSYWSTELGLIASACPQCTKGHDEMHVWTDSVAVVQPSPSDGREDGPLYFTPLLPASPTAAINLDVGDAGRLRRGNCDCLLGHIGLDLIVADVRSTRRIKAQGITLSAHGLAELVEHVLPDRFGGFAGDYQILEETSGASTRIAVLAAPRLGPLDAAALREATHAYLLRKSPLISEVLRQADVLEVRREVPQMTSGGKVLPVLIRHLPGP